MTGPANTTSSSWWERGYEKERSPVSEYVAQYDQARPDFEKCAHKIQGMLTDWLDDERVNYESVSARAKTVTSFRAKAGRSRSDGRVKSRGVVYGC